MDADQARRRRHQRRHRRHRLAVPLVIALIRLSARLPLRINHTLGYLLGVLLVFFPNTLRDTARHNLNRCLPDVTPLERQRLLQCNLVETSKSFLELGAIWHWPQHRLLERIDDTQARGLLDQVAAAGKGFIALGPHSGCWELLGLYLSTRYRPFAALYRPSRLPIDSWLKTRRERFGATLVATNTAGIRQLLATLKQGGGIGILPDQDPGPEGSALIPLFQQPARTMVLLSRLALRSGAPVVVCYMKRLPSGRGYRLHAHIAEAINHPPLEHSLRAMNQAIETVALHEPAQYLWAYRRFRTSGPFTPAFAPPA